VNDNYNLFYDIETIKVDTKQYFNDFPYKNDFPFNDYTTLNSGDIAYIMTLLISDLTYNNKEKTYM
jgi:hypothetical protein